MMRRPGVTLVELIVVITTMAVMAFVIVTMYFASTEVAKGQSTGSAVQLENFFGQGRMRTLLQDASSVVVSATLSGTLYTTDGDTVVFTVPSVDAADNLVSGAVDTVVIEYTGSAPNAYIRAIVAPHASSARPASDSRLAGSVDALQFRYSDATVTEAHYVDVTLRTRAVSGNHSARSTTESRIVLRNT